MRKPTISFLRLAACLIPFLPVPPLMHAYEVVRSIGEQGSSLYSLIFTTDIIYWFGGAFVLAAVVYGFSLVIEYLGELKDIQEKWYEEWSHGLRNTPG